MLNRYQAGGMSSRVGDTCRYNGDLRFVACRRRGKGAVVRDRTGRRRPGDGRVASPGYGCSESLLRRRTKGGGGRRNDHLDLRRRRLSALRQVIRAAADREN